MTNNNQHTLTMKKTLLTLTLLIITTFTFSQSVTNIGPRVVDDKIRLIYTISGLKYFQVVTAVKVFVSIDGGEEVGPLTELEGNTSEGIKNGKHTITWDVLKEVPFTDEDLVFDIRLTVDEKDRSKSFFVMLAGNDVTPIGLRVGMIGKTAWYVEVRGSLLAMNSPSYTYNNEAGITDYDKPGYYEFTGTGGWQAYSAIVGVTQQVMWNTFIYAGVGLASVTCVHLQCSFFDDSSMPTLLYSHASEANILHNEACARIILVKFACAILCCHEVPSSHY